VGANTQETTDGQNGIGLLAIPRHKEVINLPDRFIPVVDDAAADDLGRSIASRHLLQIDFCYLY